MKLVLLSFGKEYEYKRAILAIWSFVVHYTGKNLTVIKIFTDNPSFFKPYLESLPVEYQLLTKERIIQFRGKMDFIHRIKIEIIKESLTKNTEKVFYMDSDTFFIGDPTKYEHLISKSNSFMHLPEYKFKTLEKAEIPVGTAIRKVFKIISENKLKSANGSNFSTSPELYSWNAGVIMLDPSHLQYINDVFVITDQIYKDSKHHASEQFAFSLVLQSNTNLSACEDVIYHYWYRTKKEVVDLFLEQNLKNNWNLHSKDEKINQIKKWCERLPNTLKNHKLILKDNAIQALNSNKFGLGFYFAKKVLIRNPLQIDFIKDILYHLKRMLKMQYGDSFRLFK